MTPATDFIAKRLECGSLPPLFEWEGLLSEGLRPWQKREQAPALQTLRGIPSPYCMGVEMQF